MRLQPLDTAVAALVSAHLLFSIVAAISVLRLHRRSASSSSSRTTPSSLRRRLCLLLRLNSLWPVRLLLVLFASLLSFSELLRLPLRSPSVCSAYSLSSHSLAEPAFFSTLLFLLRASTNPSSNPPASFSSALAAAAIAVLPFLFLHCFFLFLFPHIAIALPSDFLLLSSPPDAPSDRCTQPLFSAVLLAGLGAVYVPLFVSACWGAVSVVINKKLLIRLYMLAAAVVAALSVQVSALALSALWSPDCAAAQGLSLAAFVAVLVCVAAGEGILVIGPVLDALAVVHPAGGETRVEGGGAKDGDSERGINWG